MSSTPNFISGIKFVIDTGIVKERFYDAKKGLSYLDVKAVSKSSAVQRKGRAGRTGPGICIRLYGKDEYDNFEETNQPEIKKMHLGSAVLSLMALGIADIKKFDFIERPDEDTLVSSINTLKLLGAVDQSEKITCKGKELAKLPLEPRAANIVLDGAGAGYSEEAAVLAAVLAYSSNAHFRPSEEEQRKLSDEAKVKFCNFEGDLISILEIYNEWKKRNGIKEQNQWCNENYINAKTMRAIRELINEINFSLKGINVPLLETASRPYEERQMCLKKLLTSTYYDNIAFYTGDNSIGYWSPKYGERFRIHPSSVLCMLGMNPEFVVFQDVLKTSSNFIIGVTPVDKASLEASCPNEQYTIDFSEIEDQKVTDKRFYPVGPFVIRALIGRYGETKNDLEKVITDNGKLPGRLEINTKAREVVVFAAKKRRKMIVEFVEEEINKQIKILEDETSEENLGQRKTGHRVLIKAGGEVQEIFQPSETCNMTIEIQKKNENEVIRKEMVEMISNLIMRKLDGIKDEKRIKKEMIDSHKSIKWGEVYFTKLEAMEEAKKQLNFVGIDHNIIAKECQSKTGEQSKVAITWSRRGSRGFGFVQCRSAEALSRVSSRISYTSKQDKKRQNYLFVTGIDRMLNSEAFQRSIREQVHDENDVIDAYIVFEKSFQEDLEEEIDRYEKRIREILKDVSIQSIFCFPIQNNNVVTCRANLFFSRFQDAEKAKFLLSDGAVIGKINYSFLNQ